MSIVKLFKRAKCELQYWEACRKADKLAMRTGVVFFVLPLESGKLIVIDKDGYEKFRIRHLTPKDMPPRDLFRESVYHTRCRSINGRKSKKRKFLRWKGF